MTAFDESPSNVSYITGESDEMARRRELETKMRADAALKECAGLEKEAVAGIVINQAFDTFKDTAPLRDPLVRAVLNAAPMAFLRPTVDSRWEDPRLWGVAGVVAVLAAKHIRFVP
jgi:hypothetical protein